MLQGLGIYVDPTFDNHTGLQGGIYQKIRGLLLLSQYYFALSSSPSFELSVRFGFIWVERFDLLYDFCPWPRSSTKKLACQSVPQPWFSPSGPQRLSDSPRFLWSPPSGAGRRVGQPLVLLA